MKIKIEIGNNYSYIKDFIPDNIYLEISNTLSYKVLNCEWTVSYNTIKNDGTRVWDGRKRLIKKNKKYIKIPTGLIGRVVKILKKHNYNIQYLDQRPVANDILKNVSLNEFKKPRPYQDESTDKAIKIERGIIKAPTGSGKTFMAALMFSKKPCKRFVFFVLSIDLLKQTKTEFEEVLLQNGSPLEVGTVGDGVCDIKDVTIVSIKTACGAFNIKYEVPSEYEKKDEEEINLNIENKEKIKDLITNCQFIIFDEVHHAPCDTVQDVLKRCREARYRFGLSASPWRDDNADLEIESFFGRNIVDISASYLIRSGYLIKPYIYFISQEYESPSSKLTYQNVYKEYITENEKRNNIIKRVVEHLKDQGRTILILVKIKKHGKKLESEIPDSIFIHGGHSGDKRKDVLNKLRNKEIKVVISTSIFDQGIDVKALDALVLTASGKSSTRALQRIGRVIRKYENKENAIIIDFNDKIKYLSSHCQARRKIYKTEEEFEINDVEVEEILNKNL